MPGMAPACSCLRSAKFKPHPRASFPNPASPAPHRRAGCEEHQRHCVRPASARGDRAPGEPHWQQCAVQVGWGGCGNRPASLHTSLGMQHVRPATSHCLPTAECPPPQPPCLLACLQRAARGAAQAGGGRAGPGAGGRCAVCRRHGAGWESWEGWEGWEQASTCWGAPGPGSCGSKKCQAAQAVAQSKAETRRCAASCACRHARRTGTPRMAPRRCQAGGQMPGRSYTPGTPASHTTRAGQLAVL